MQNFIDYENKNRQQRKKIDIKKIFDLFQRKKIMNKCMQFSIRLTPNDFDQI